MKLMKGFFSTPLDFLCEVAGTRRVQLKQKQHIFKLGKQCLQCHKPIIHRDSISICQCYSFSHKTCLINQLQRQALSECTAIKCGECKSMVHAVVDFDYDVEVKKAWKRDLMVLGVCVVVVCLATVYLTRVREGDGGGGEDDMGQQRQASSAIAQVLAVAVMFVFGTLFWLTLMGMLLKRNTKVRDILSTCVDIRVSAFLQLQNKIRQQTLQQIPVKKQLSSV